MKAPTNNAYQESRVSDLSSCFIAAEKRRPMAGDAYWLDVFCSRDQGGKYEEWDQSNVNYSSK